MQELLAEPIFALALVTLKDEVTEMLRGESQGFDFVKGFNNCIDTLTELAIPIPTQVDEPEPDWGLEEPKK